MNSRQATAAILLFPGAAAAQTLRPFVDAELCRPPLPEHRLLCCAAINRDDWPLDLRRYPPEGEACPELTAEAITQMRDLVPRVPGASFHAGDPTVGDGTGSADGAVSKTTAAGGEGGPGETGRAEGTGPVVEAGKTATSASDPDMPDSGDAAGPATDTPDETATPRTPPAGGGTVSGDGAAGDATGGLTPDDTALEDPGDAPNSGSSGGASGPDGSSDGRAQTGGSDPATTTTAEGDPDNAGCRAGDQGGCATGAGPSSASGTPGNDGDRGQAGASPSDRDIGDGARDRSDAEDTDGARDRGSAAAIPAPTEIAEMRAKRPMAGISAMARAAAPMRRAAGPRGEPRDLGSRGPAIAARDCLPLVKALEPE